MLHGDEAWVPPSVQRPSYGRFNTTYKAPKMTTPPQQQQQQIETSNFQSNLFQEADDDADDDLMNRYQALRKESTPNQQQQQQDVQAASNASPKNFFTSPGTQNVFETSQNTSNPFVKNYVPTNSDKQQQQQNVFGTPTTNFGTPTTNTSITNSSIYQQRTPAPSVTEDDAFETDLFENVQRLLYWENVVLSFLSLVTIIFGIQLLKYRPMWEQALQVVLQMDTIVQYTFHACAVAIVLPMIMAFVGKAFRGKVSKLFSDSQLDQYWNRKGEQAQMLARDVVRLMRKAVQFYIDLVGLKNKQYTFKISAMFLVAAVCANMFGYLNMITILFAVWFVTPLFKNERIAVFKKVAANTTQAIWSTAQQVQTKLSNSAKKQQLQPQQQNVPTADLFNTVTGDDDDVDEDDFNEPMTATPASAGNRFMQIFK